MAIVTRPKPFPSTRIQKRSLRFGTMFAPERREIEKFLAVVLLKDRESSLTLNPSSGGG